MSRIVGFGLCLVIALMPAHGQAVCEPTEARCDMDATGPDGQPIVFWRIKQEDRDALADLLDAGYDIETTGGFGMTPLLQAAMIDDWIMVEMLLDRGAEAGVADRRGFTVPYLAHR